VPAAKRGLAMVFQSYALYPHMTVAENMSVGLRIAGASKAVIRSKVAEAAGILQLDGLLDRLPRQLSGGQRQRVAIGRAIVRKPKIFLFDEPLSNLDAALRLQMRLELARLKQDLDATMIYVTHDQVEAMTLADKIVVMNGGAIEQVGTPLELYRKPANLFVAGFIGSPKMNFLAATVSRIAGDRALLELAGGVGTIETTARALSVGDPVTLGIRPEHLRTGSIPAGCARLGGSIMVVERLGANSFVYLQLADRTAMTVELDGMSDVVPGATLEIGLPPDAVHVFDHTGRAV
jgi:multiple sugar transport system ATP-binding protein